MKQQRKSTLRAAVLGDDKLPAEFRTQIVQKDGSPTLVISLPDDFCRAMGSKFPEFAKEQVALMFNALSPSGGYPSDERLKSVIAMVATMKPKSEMECALAVQMAVTHILSMEALGQMKRATLPQVLDVRTTAATKLQRTFLAQMEAFHRLRRGGKQTVVVQHTTVQAGGQAAVIGKMSRAGGRLKREAQSYAPTHALEG